MSRQIGLDVLHLRRTPRLGHAEYCSSDAIMRDVEARTGKAFFDGWDIDFVWNTDDGPIAWEKAGRCTDMGHAEFLEGGVDWRDAGACPFRDPEEVLAFDAVREYGAPELDVLTEYYEKRYRELAGRFPNQVVTGGYYRSMMSGAIQSFGWEMLLLAAADRSGFARVLDSFFRLSLQHYKAWARTSVEAFICHDDMVWTEGPFLSPDFYRSEIFPRYAALWKVVKDAGKRVLFCSDGDWSMFLDDIAAAGADGFILEPTVSLDAVVAKYGQSHVIVGSKVDCRTLTFGALEDIQAEIDATLDVAFGCGGFMFAVGNHIPSNVPVENARFYYDYLSSHWARG